MFFPLVFFGVLVGAEYTTWPTPDDTERQGLFHLDLTGMGRVYKCGGICLV